MADKFEVQLRECLLTWNNMLIKYWCSWKFWGKKHPLWETKQYRNIEIQLVQMYFAD